LQYAFPRLKTFSGNNVTNNEVGKSFFRADPKRKRKNYDSYTLCKNKQSIASEQWHMRELKHFQEETFSWQKIEKIVYSRDFLKEIGILEKQRIKTVLDW